MDWWKEKAYLECWKDRFSRMRDSFMAENLKDMDLWN